MSGRRGLGACRLDDTVEEGNWTVTVRAEWCTIGGGRAEGCSDDELRRPVLVKRLKPGLQRTGALSRAFRCEADLLQRLDHPSLPTLIDYVADGDDLALVLPDYGGVRLQALLEELGRLDFPMAMAVGIEVARALSVLHRHGMVHGHLLARYVELNPSGLVRLFGLSPPPPGAEPSGDEAVDDLLPLPEDMAPEQIIGEPADVRTDVFLLGLLLYRMVAADQPFGDRGGVLSHRIRHGRALSLQRNAPGVPPSLERIVARCLRRRPRDRYPDVASVTTALIRALRARTSVPTEQLVAAVLAKADRAPQVAPAAEPDEPDPAMGGARLARRLGAPAAVVAVLGLLGWTIASALTDDDTEVAAGVRGIEQQPARLRVLARPWAEVHVDGSYVDVTPIGRPIDVTPGRHSVRFKHPNAPDQVRSVEVIAGQTMWLDVTMAVQRPEPDGGPPDGSAGDASP